ncbi:MAG: flagellar basal body rod protein FlgB [Planctomycetes bacterium]|nr:flagellar basal body rod protein FlgB [Planctomycetota bacterium]
MAPLTRTMFKGAIPVLEKVLTFTEERHRVLANNIANIDTPYFKARDLPTGEFDHMLGRAIEDRRRGNPRLFHMGGSRDIQVLPYGRSGDTTLRPKALEQRELNILAHDENRRFVEVEMAELTKNTMRHNTAAALLRHQFSLIESAIRERPS